MAGNKHDNGVHEIGTPETLKAYQEDTPGQEVEKYLAGIQEVIQEKKNKQKKTFMQVFQNPLKGFPYNEELDDNFVKPLEEAKNAKYLELKFRDKNEAIKAYRTINNKIFPGGTQPFEDFVQEGSWLQFDNVQDVKGVLKAFKKGGLKFNIEVQESLEEGRLSDLLIDIQQGATAKELARDWKIPLSVAKDFLADYYSSKRDRRPRKEEVELEEAKNLMPEIQKIVDRKQHSKVGGIVIDMFTASMITQIYDKVNDANKKKMETSNISTLVNLAQRIMQKSENDPIEENYKDVIKMYPRDRDWKKLITKHRKNIDDFRDGKKDLDKKVEDELISWALDAGEIRNKGEVEDFIDDILNEENLDEMSSGDMIKKLFKVKNDKEVKGIANLMNMTDTKVLLKMKKDNPKGFARMIAKMGELPAMEEVQEEISEVHKSSLAVNPKNVNKFKPMLQKYADKFGVELEFGIGGKMPSVVQIKSKSSGAEKNFMSAVNKDRKLMSLMDETIKEAQTYKSIIQGLEKDKKEISKKSKSFGQNDTKFVDKAINFLKMLEKEGIPAGQISQVDFVTNRVPKFFVGNPQKSPSFSKFTPNDVKKAVAHAKKMGIMESVDLQEGTWQIPDSYDQLVALQRFLSKPHKAKTAREVHKFHIDADRFFGDDSFSDMLDAYYHTLPGGDIDPYDKKEKVSPKSMERAKKYNKIKPGTDLNILLMKALTDWTGGDLKFDRRGKITQSPRDWYEKNNPKLRNKSNVVTDVIESKMSGSKLTGQEISVYFRRNKVRDKTVRKAIEIALDHGGAMNYAIKQIEKLKRGLSKNKDVQKALNYANFGEQVRIKEVGFMFKEDSPVAGNIQVEGDPYIPFKTGSGKLNKNIEKYWKKEIRGISKDELLKIQSMYMITDHSGVVAMYKAGKRDFLKSLKD